MVIQCRGDLLLIKTVQFANKKAMSVAEYIRGNELEEGTVLGREEI